jgi:DSF synthase
MNAISEQINLFDQNFRELNTRYDQEYGVLWAYMNPQPVPCFTPGILADMRDYQAIVQSSGGVVATQGQLRSIDYLVLASRVPGVFNLGGDLNLFRQLIVEGEREKLFHYAKACIDVLYPNIVNYNLPITTLSLVQGDALGGGFEAALSSDLIVAEKSAQMGLPEVLFNLFPGMGAYSLIARRLGMKKAEQFILSGRIYTAEELHEIGLVDILAEDGEGEIALYDYIKKQSRRKNALNALAQVRQRCNPVTYEELIDVTRIWVDAAFRLQDKDLRMMDRLVRAQQKFAKGAQPTANMQAAA